MSRLPCAWLLFRSLTFNRTDTLVSPQAQRAADYDSIRPKIAAAAKFLLIVQLRRTSDKRARSIPETLENCSRWFGRIRNDLIAEIAADLPRFSEGINCPCFSHYGRFGSVRHQHPHRHVPLLLLYFPH